MKTVLTLLMFFIFTLNVFAGEVPQVLLQEGANDISITVVNHSGAELNGLKFSAEPEKIPDWLSINENNQIIDITNIEDEKGRFFLNFNVTNAPGNTFAELPYSIVDENGNEWKFALKLYVGAITEESAPLCTALHNNYPNPFNPCTTIKYSLEKNFHTKLVIYNTIGQAVRTLVDGPMVSGFHTVEWDGMNEHGQKVSSGLYLYKLTAGSHIDTKRMMLIE